ncbi:5-formyltetrahydrofolate cyclo-ligase [Mahella australiensis]|uniref:5-formyltetrahydrofolate cyclo-ligase n=1 Tax=Mahella australiensis (strain DSM 15567 / CIP 107919 / 50-1 BON) TaxID=697281 RepID=F4A305_MAHA5|nr:5-formyltetrahydrofolate cyclo-ligase [Mahella australiensis]AEE97348.1 5-formyltetrahydrofolate cyclo-ligase [Mahella australiensis 50-1 BON]
MSKEKKLIRQAVLEKRSRLTPLEAAQKSEAICRAVVATRTFVSARFIMAYIDARNEVQTECIIRQAWAEGKRLAVPVCIPQTHTLLVSELTSFEELRDGFYGIKEPMEEYMRPASPEQLDIIIVPAVAYDRRGYRIGYGGGYYDRFLSSLDKDIVTIGIAFDIQIVGEVPVQPFDIPVDMVITESGIIKGEKS